MIIDCAIYRHGLREDMPRGAKDIEAALESLEDPLDFIWIGMYEPTNEEMATVSTPLSLHPLAVEDAIDAHQRPKVERYENHLFMSIKTITYHEDQIETGEISLFLGQHYLVTVRHGRAHELAEVRRRAEANVKELEHGAIAALYSVVDSIVDEYEDVAAELETDVQEVEASVFSHERTSDSSRIYLLKRETLEFRRAVTPLREPIHRFAVGAMPEETQPYFRDIADHLARVAESIDGTDKLLDNALSAHLAQLSIQQNDDMRKLAAGAALFAIPTAIAGIYGMNFDHMPELDWTVGYPLVLIVIVALCFYVYHRFKQSGWL